MPRKTTAPADDAAQITRAPRTRASRARAAAPEPDTVSSEAPPRRAAPRPAREAPRDPAREPARSGAVMVQGRDGEQLTRRRTTVGDIHHVPANEIPRGWDYQWNTVTVTGQEMREEQMVMQQNGWRPVPASRHAGRWTPPEYKGAIIVKGLRLEERPTELGDEARAEDVAHAKAQVRDQTDVLKLSKKMPEGMAINSRKFKGTGGEVRISIDQALDIPRPAHQIEE